MPLYSVEEFKQLAPEELRTPEVLANEHQLMLNRLSFELTERQRYVQFFTIPPSLIPVRQAGPQKARAPKAKG